VEHVLLAAAAGASLALLPESAAERFAGPGIRFVSLERSDAAFGSAVLTLPNTASLATLAFLRAQERAADAGVARGARARVELAA
jgi:hypothetical protein